LNKIKVSERIVFISEAHYPDYEVKNGSIYFDAIVQVIDVWIIKDKVIQLEIKWWQFKLVSLS